MPDLSPPPPAEVAGRGHTLVWDPPHGLSSVQRWTCGCCGDAVLSAYGNVYGSATGRDCPHKHDPDGDDDDLVVDQTVAAADQGLIA